MRDRLNSKTVRANERTNFTIDCILMATIISNMSDINGTKKTNDDNKTIKQIRNNNGRLYRMSIKL